MRFGEPRSGDRLGGGDRVEQGLVRDPAPGHDLGSAAALGTQLRDGLSDVPSGGTVTVDLTRTSYLASAGVGLLLELAAVARARGVDLRTAVAPGSVTTRRPTRAIR